MRNPWRVALLAAAALAVLALAGTSVAAAKNVTLCKENLKECPEKSRYPAGTKLSLKLVEGKKAVLKSAFRTIECQKSEISAVTENQSGSAVITTINEFSLKECKSGATECTVSPLGLTWWGEIAFWNFFIAYHYRIVQHSGGGRPRFQDSCGGVSCTYGNEPIGSFKWESGAPATLYAEALELKKETGSNALCSSTATLTATYTVSSPNPLYITEVT